MASTPAVINFYIEAYNNFLQHGSVEIGSTISDYNIINSQPCYGVQFGWTTVHQPHLRFEYVIMDTLTIEYSWIYNTKQITFEIFNRNNCTDEFEILITLILSNPGFIQLP